MAHIEAWRRTLPCRHTLCKIIQPWPTVFPLCHWLTLLTTYFVLSSISSNSIRPSAPASAPGPKAHPAFPHDEALPAYGINKACPSKRHHQGIPQLSPLRQLCVVRAAADSCSHLRLHVLRQHLARAQEVQRLRSGVASLAREEPHPEPAAKHRLFRLPPVR